MTEQEKREKLIKGLECCLGKGQKRGMCEDCPYDNTGRMKCNLGDLHVDALALLKSQEPKKPIVSGMIYGNYLEHCPSCEIALPNSSEYGTSFYCYKCGQELKWDG